MQSDDLWQAFRSLKALQMNTNDDTKNKNNSFTMEFDQCANSEEERAEKRGQTKYTIKQRLGQ